MAAADLAGIRTQPVRDHPGTARPAAGRLSARLLLGSGAVAVGSTAGRLRDRPYVIFSLSQALAMGGWLPVLALLAVYFRDHLGSTVLAAMVTILVIQTVASAVSLFAGSFASRWGGRRTLLIGTAGMMAFAALLSLIGEGWQVIALAPLAGLVVPFFWTGTSTYLLQSVAPARRGAGTGVNAFVMTLAPGITGPVLTWLGQAVGIWSAILGGAGLLAISSLVVLAPLPELEPGPGPALGERRFPLSGYLRLLSDRFNLAAAFARLVSGLNFGVFQLLSALVLLDLTGQLAAVGFYLTAGAIGGGASQVLVGALSDRIGRRNLLAGSMLIGAGAALLFWRSEILPLLLLAAAMQAFSHAAYHTLITAISGDLVAPAEIPAISGLHTSMFSTGMVVGALLAGLLWQVDHRAAFLVAAALYAPALYSVFVLPRRTLQA